MIESKKQLDGLIISLEQEIEGEESSAQIDSIRESLNDLTTAYAPLGAATVGAEAALAAVELARLRDAGTTGGKRRKSKRKTKKGGRKRKSKKRKSRRKRKSKRKSKKKSKRTKKR